MSLHLALTRGRARRIREGTPASWNRVERGPPEGPCYPSGGRGARARPNAGSREHFGVNVATLTGDSEDDLESCRIVADLARLEGYDAILSPSAALDGARNLNLYIDRRADHLRLMEGPDRVPLNY